VVIAALGDLEVGVVARGELDAARGNEIKNSCTEASTSS
jgi:hypothetical protein